MEGKMIYDLVKKKLVDEFPDENTVFAIGFVPYEVLIKALVRTGLVFKFEEITHLEFGDRGITFRTKSLKK